LVLEITAYPHPATDWATFEYRSSPNPHPSVLGIRTADTPLNIQGHLASTRTVPVVPGSFGVVGMKSFNPRRGQVAPGRKSEKFGAPTIDELDGAIRTGDPDDHWERRQGALKQFGVQAAVIDSLGRQLGGLPSRGGGWTPSTAQQRTMGGAAHDQLIGRLLRSGDGRTVRMSLEGLMGRHSRLAGRMRSGPALGPGLARRFPVGLGRISGGGDDASTL
jgi:hypothetical protein